MARATLVAGFTAVVFLLIVRTSGSRTPGREAPPLDPPAAVILDEKRRDYLEDEGTGRRLAGIHASLVRRGEGIRLRIVAAATGPGVDPVPGWRGVHGANRITAEEIQSIVGERRMRVETEGADPAGATIELGRRGRLPERRRARDGSIDVTGTTDVEYPLELVATTAAIGNGTRRTRLNVDGVPRLEVVTTITNGRGVIRDVRALPEPETERP